MQLDCRDTPRHQDFRIDKTVTCATGTTQASETAVAAVNPDPEDIWHHPDWELDDVNAPFGTLICRSTGYYRIDVDTFVTFTWRPVGTGFSAKVYTTSGSPTYTNLRYLAYMNEPTTGGTGVASRVMRGSWTEIISATDGHTLTASMQLDPNTVASDQATWKTNVTIGERIEW